MEILAPCPALHCCVGRWWANGTSSILRILPGRRDDSEHLNPPLDSPHGLPLAGQRVISL